MLARVQDEDGQQQSIGENTELVDSVLATHTVADV